MRKAFLSSPTTEENSLNTSLAAGGADGSYVIACSLLAWNLQHCTMHEKNEKLNEKKLHQITLHSMTHAYPGTKACQQIKIFLEMTSLSTAFFRTHKTFNAELGRPATTTTMTLFAGESKNYHLQSWENFMSLDFNARSVATGCNWLLAWKGFKASYHSEWILGGGPVREWCWHWLGGISFSSCEVAWHPAGAGTKVWRESTAFLVCREQRRV